MAGTVVSQRMPHDWSPVPTLSLSVSVGYLERTDSDTKL